MEETLTCNMEDKLDSSKVLGTFVKQKYLALTVLAHLCLDQPEGIIYNSSVLVSVDLKRSAGIILK